MGNYDLIGYVTNIDASLIVSEDEGQDRLSIYYLYIPVHGRRA